MERSKRRNEFNRKAIIKIDGILNYRETTV